MDKVTHEMYHKFYSLFNIVGASKWTGDVVCMENKKYI
jgi:hypothetical protein